MIVVTVARKPLTSGTVAANVLTVGTGALNIDASRVGTHKNTTPSGMDRYNAGLQEQGYRPGSYAQGTPEPPAVTGRWPANLILQHLEGCKCLGSKRVWANQSSTPGSGVGHENTPGKGIYHGVGGKVKAATADADGMETVEDWNCDSGCPIADLDRQSGIQKSGVAVQRHGGGQFFGTTTYMGTHRTPEERARPDTGFGDEGGASRFFKQVGGKQA